ncbi:type IV pilus biogenesis protein PilM [Acinetobacter variabilis]|uniref:type IV pilus biogenesis protein PilM n=1 Tax=Acinetobacter variabilis TaxID=70346 RepID=UPI0028A7D4B7|nr:type IV pilus biogenesis protein PilM [Acinetobacter variabilis]
MTAYVQLVMAISIVILSALLTSKFNEQNKLSTGIAIEQQVRAMSAYIDSAAEYKQSNNGATGNITGKISLPSWMLARTGVTVYAEAGQFYIYVQNRPGLLTEIRKSSFNSARLGRIENNTIKLTDGSIISKPAIIPANSVVYIL